MTRHSSRAAEAAPLRFGAARSRFFGRSVELEALASALAEGPLLTVTGTAGVGKTRLALEHARTLPAGTVLLADLVEARDPGEVAIALRDALGARDEAPATLGAAARTWGPALLILDGCEGAVAHVAACVGELLSRAPELTCLATSRRTLGLTGERIFQLEPLALPVDASEIEVAGSSALFLDRARHETTTLHLDDATAAGVVEISARLGGLPLAIELCASRLRVMTVAELARDLSRGLGALGAGRRDVARRHASLHRALAPSWEMLSTWEQAALARASVFRGGFTVAAAEHVLDLAADPAAPPCLDVLQALVDHSLLGRGAPRGGTGVVFWLYESVRHFAGEQLGEAASSALARHEEHFLALAGGDAGDPDAGGDDLVAALQRALARPSPRDAPRLLAAALIADASLARRGSLSLRLSLLDGAIPAQDGASPQLIAALLARAEILAEVGRIAEARGDRRRARELGRALPGASAQASLGAALAAEALDDGRLDDAREIGEELVASQRALGDRRAEAEGLVLLARARRRQGDLLAAREHAERAVMVARSAGASRMVSIAVAELAITTHDAGDLTTAERCHESVRLESRASGDRLAATFAGSEGLLRLELALRASSSALDLHDVRASLERSRSELRAAGARLAEATTLGSLGLVEEAQGLGASARVHYEEAATIYRDAERAELAGLTRAWIGRLEASCDRLAEARDALEEARLGALAGGAAGLATVYDLCEGHLALAERRAALARGDAHGAETCRRRVDRLLAATPDAAPSAHVRVARALLLREASALIVASPDTSAEPRPPASPGALVVSATGRWFKAPSGARVVLDTRRALRLILRRLAEARETSPVAPLDVPALLNAGWPEDRVLHEAGVSRVYAAVSHLRREGLRDVLLRRDDGYLLDPGVPFVREPDWP